MSEEKTTPPEIEPYSFTFNEILIENELSLKDLPLKIRNRHKPVAPALAKYMEEGTEEAKNDLIKHDYALVELILEHIDSQLPTEEEYLKNNPDAAAQRKKEDEQREEAHKQAEVEQKLSENSAGVISIADLSTILKKRVKSSQIRIGSIVLRKVFLRQEFKRVQ